MVPALFGIVTLGIYKLFELFVRRRERMLLIEKLDLSQLPSFNPGRLQLPAPVTANAMTAGCLLLGLGLGLVIGILLSTQIHFNDSYFRQSQEMVCGGSILIFGGIGMIASVFINRALDRKQ